MSERILVSLRRFLGHPCFPYFVALMGFLDMFLFFVPNDLLLVSEAVASPRRRISSVLIVSLGSAFGALALAYALRAGISVYWSARESGVAGYYARFGNWALFLGAAAPFPVQFFVAAALFVPIGIPQIFCLVLGGRLVKYTVLAFFSGYLPARLRPKSPIAENPK